MLIAEFALAAFRIQLAHQAVAAEHANCLIKVRVVGANHAPFNGAQMMGIVKGKVRRQPDSAELAASKSRSVRFAHVLDKWNAATVEFRNEIVAQAVVPQ